MNRSSNFEPLDSNGIMQRDYGSGGEERREDAIVIAKAVGVLWTSLSLSIYLYPSNNNNNNNWLQHPNTRGTKGCVAGPASRLELPAM